ncbi:GAK10 protein, partial [Chordeiles acutipennis]|nr:GAK10 protein [Chordeiles acutipennis]
IESSEAADFLLFQLAIENANTDCKQAIDPIRNRAKTLIDLIKACQNAGDEQHKADILVAAWAQQLVDAWAAAKCFFCGQEEHFKRNCPEKNKKDLGPAGQGKQYVQLCPRCQKGYHWSNQCRSKFDRQGNPLSEKIPGNGKRYVRSGTPRSYNRAQPLTTQP